MPIIGTGTELEAVLNDSGGKDVYIIGSGEHYVGDVVNFRGEGIAEVLESDRLKVVYVGRDQNTRVWKLVH